MLRRLLFAGARGFFGLFMLTTSLYCLLAYIPFTYYGFLQFDHLGWLTMWVRYHPPLYALAFGAVILTLQEDLRGRTRTLPLSFIALGTVLGIGFTVFPLRELQNSFGSFVWSLAALLPLFWLTVIDGAGRLDKIGWLAGADGEGDGEGDGETARQFWAALLSAVFLALVYHGIFSLRSADAGFSGGERLLGLLWSLMTHLLVFMALFMVLRLLSGLAGLARRPQRLELGLVLLLCAALAALTLHGTVLAALSFGGVHASVYALAFGLALAVYAAGLGIRLYRPAQRLSHPLELLFTALSGLRPAALLFIPPLAYSLLVRAAPFDWHFLLQRLSVVLVWTLSFGLIYSALRAPASPLLRLPRGAGLALLLLATATAGGYRLLELSGPVLARRAGLDAAATLKRYGGYDLSYGLTSRLVAPPGSRAGLDFYRFCRPAPTSRAALRSRRWQSTWWPTWSRVRALSLTSLSWPSTA